MDLTREDYQRQLLQLLPEGPVWPRDSDTVIAQVLAAIGDSLARLDRRAIGVLLEIDPRVTNELLADWERNFGLPDECVGAEQVLQERRGALMTRVTGTGGQSRVYFYGLSASLGFAITISEFRPFRVGQSRVGDALNDEAWAHVWRVNAPETTVTSFRPGLSAVGEPLRKWGSAVLECVFSRLKPAHTILMFGYGGEDVSLIEEGLAYGAVPTEQAVDDLHVLIHSTVPSQNYW